MKIFENCQGCCQKRLTILTSYLSTPWESSSQHLHIDITTQRGHCALHLQRMSAYGETSAEQREARRIRRREAVKEYGAFGCLLPNRPTQALQPTVEWNPPFVVSETQTVEAYLVCCPCWNRVFTLRTRTTHLMESSWHKLRMV